MRATQNIISEKKISQMYNELRGGNRWSLLKAEKRVAIVKIVNHFAREAMKPKEQPE